MSLVIKIGEVEYTLQNEDKYCGNCSHKPQKDDFYREAEIEQYGWGFNKYPEHHPCKGCINFSNWHLIPRHLYDIIEYLQDELNKTKE